MKKDRNGHEEKTVTYKIGDQQYSLKMVTDQRGRLINRERKMNFPEGLSNVACDATYYSISSIAFD